MSSSRFQGDLWSQAAQHDDRHSPLSYRMRPKTLADLVGERPRRIGARLMSWAQQGRIPSLLLYGPSGTGKTTLARLLAQEAQQFFEELSGVHASVKDIHATAELAKTRLPRRTIVFLDEIHRFNRGQQDSLLPYVESGVFTLIGATTENPSFYLNSALLSRLQVLRLEMHTDADLTLMLNRALTDREYGLALHQAQVPAITSEALHLIAQLAQGDARRALTLLELCVQEGQIEPPSTLADSGAPWTPEVIRSLLERLGRADLIPHDRTGDAHYQLVSAFIKSMRDSDDNAAIYYLARMIAGGEDPLFIARRLIVFASEDIGLADAQALTLATSAFAAVERLGMPEGRIPLAHATAYLARAPKNNHAYAAIGAALECVQETGPLPIPNDIQNAPTQWMKQQGIGKGYVYPHDVAGKKTGRSHLPEGLPEAWKRRKFFPEG